MSYEVNQKMNQEILNVYNTISHLETFAARAARGQKSTIQETGEGWIIKSDLRGEELVEWEYEMYAHIHNEGHDFAPQVDEEEGVFGYPCSFMLQKINNGATLRDYIEAYVLGLVPQHVLEALFEAVGQLLSDFWEAGYTHRDLHTRNIVIGMDRRATAWRPYLIDFSSATHAEQEEDWAYENGLILAELETQEDDLDTLLHGDGGIWDIAGDKPPAGLQRAVHLLQGAITAI